MAATEDKLSDLHGDLADMLAEAIKPQPVFDKDTGEVIGNKINPAALNVARQFLKDNNIQAVPESKHLKGLIDELPDFESNPELILFKG